MLGIQTAIMCLKQFFANRADESERGASLVEYALLVALIAIVCIGALTVLGGSINGTLTGAAGSFP